MKDDDTENVNVKKSRIDENESDDDLYSNDEEIHSDSSEEDADSDSPEDDAASDLTKHELSDAEVVGKTYKIFEATDFEWQSFIWGPPKSKLVIFTSEAKSLCYEFSRNNNIWYCRCCRKQNALTRVKIVKNEAGEECVKIINENHVCDPVQYTPEVQYRNYLSTEFELRPNRNGVPNKSLVIFSNDDRSQCFNFKLNGHGFLFVCNGCTKFKKNLSAKLMKDGNGQDYIKMMDQKHVCQPKMYKPYEPREPCEPYKAQSETEIIDSPNFELHPNKNGIPNGFLIIYASEDRKTCWKFSLRGKSYRCLDCNKIKSTYAWLRNEGNQQYVEAQTSHVCEPKKYCPKPQAPKPTVSKTTFYHPDFELRPNQNGVPNGSLIIFASEDRKTCWKFRLNRKPYMCIACSMKKHYTGAWLLTNESGEQYVEVCTTHICKPKKYEPPKEPVGYSIIPSSQFELCPNTKGIPNSRLHIFTSPEKTSCYHFFLDQGYFRCCGCRKQKKSTTVKLMKNESEDYLQMKADAEHVCKPRIGIPKLC